MQSKASQTYLTLMGFYWLVFGLITTFYPRLMDLFQSSEGVATQSAFSDHVWFHGGLDILALCVLLFTLARMPANRTILRAAAVAALMPTIAIAYSLLATPYWNPLFIVAGLGCFAFVVWGFLLAERFGRNPLAASSSA
jgi:Flp pilus assembly protein protease CpaA